MADRAGREDAPEAEHATASALAGLNATSSRSNGSVAEQIVAREVFTCEKCKAELLSANSLREHERLRHLDEQRCAYCTYSCNAVYMKNHVKQYHSGEYSCSLCYSSHVNLNAARQHVLTRQHQRLWQISKLPRFGTHFGFTNNVCLTKYRRFLSAESGVIGTERDGGVRLCDSKR
jgi:hypothetical protein